MTQEPTESGLLPLQGRAAVVTGVSRRVGIGFAVASRLAALGADLFVHSFAPFDAAQPWGADAEGVAPLLADLRNAGARVDTWRRISATPTPLRASGLRRPMPSATLTS